MFDTHFFHSALLFIHARIYCVKQVFYVVYDEIDGDQWGANALKIIVAVSIAVIMRVHYVVHYTLSTGVVTVVSLFSVFVDGPFDFSFLTKTSV